MVGTYKIALILVLLKLCRSHEILLPSSDDIARAVSFLSANYTSDEFSYGTRSVVDDMQCLLELTQIMQQKTLAMNFFDAWGRPPSGIFMGNSHDLGNYDECLKINVPAEKSESTIKGKYCMAAVPLNEIANGAQASPYGAVTLNVGICAPASCSAESINHWIKRLLKEQLNVELKFDLVQERSCDVKFDEALSGATITGLVIFGILGVIMLLCTIYDYAWSETNSLHPMMKAFSLRHNAYQLFQIVDYTGNSNVVPCLNGIRCISLMWVIIGHDFVTLIQLPNINMADLMEWVETLSAMFITQAFFSVDTFFFLSGLLIAMVGLREMERNSGRLNVPLMYLHRYLRLTPILAYAIFFYLSLRYLGNGPLWNTLAFGWRPSFEACSDYWWSTLLYVHNYVNPSHMCMSHSWYLAVDTQLYLLSPIFLFAVYRWGKRTIAATTIIMLLFAAWLFTISYIYDMNMFWKTALRSKMSVMNTIYFPTHVRPSPWFIGLMFGYYLHITKGRRFVLSKGVQVLGWLTCFLLFAICIFALYPKSQSGAAPLTDLEGALFLTLTRIAWPVALCWLVFACVKGYGGPIESFLGSPLWQPLARLSYAMYIFHFGIIYVNNSTTHTSTYFSGHQVVLHFLYDYGSTLLYSLLMYLIVEAPIASFVQALMPKRKPTAPAKTQSTEIFTTAQEKEALS